jgi:transcriptional regulatory protein LevR
MITVITKLITVDKRKLMIKFIPNRINPITDKANVSVSMERAIDLYIFIDNFIVKPY